MDTLILRDAVTADAPALATLNKTAMGYDYPIEGTAEQLTKLLADGRNKIIVAEVDGRLVGYLHLVDYDLIYAGHMENIMGIAVDPNCRRMGIGRQLLTAGEQWAKGRGAEAVRLASGESRVGAHAFYRALGYEGNKMQLNLKKAL